LSGAFTSKTYNNQFKGSGRIIYLLSIFFSLGAFIFAPLCWFFIWRMLRRKVAVETDGITIYYALHKTHLQWNEIAGYGYDERDFMNAPIAYGVDGKKYRISMAFKLCPQKIGWRTNYIIDSSDALNQAIMTELQAGLSVNKPSPAIVPNIQAATAYTQSITTPLVGSASMPVPTLPNVPPQVMNAYDVQHLMRGGKISQSSVADIVYEWQTSKIVKFGSFILYLFWTGVVAGVYHIPGFIAWIILTIAIFIDYRWYKKTKSEVAWKFLQSLIGILVLVLISFSISGHYYSP
jgi:hypothetical protein